MHHLLLVCLLLVITFCVLSLRNSVENAYWSLASFPILVFLVGAADESFRGIQQFNHQLLHVAYDSSYVLLLIGIVVILRAVLRRRRIVHVLPAICIAAVPISYLWIT